MTSPIVRDLAESLPPNAEARLLPSGVRFVEFFGLPGIGKTTTSSLLVNSLRQCGSGEVRMAREPRTFIARQLYRIGIVVPRFWNPEFRSMFGRIARFAMESGQASVVDLVRVVWNLSVLVAYIENERLARNSIVIMDQGLLQGFWSILLKSKRRATSENWLDILSAIGVYDMVFVHLRSEAGVAQGRLRTRDDRSSRMQKISPDREFQLWSMADRGCREIAADLGRKMRAEDHAGLVAAVDVDRLASPKDVAERALEAVLLACLDRHRLCDSAEQ
ncbi:MAG: hypothetical protein ABIQ51_24410 [Mesorhizobium sp.]